MSDSEILLKAAINRVAARIKAKLISSAEELTEIADEIPQKIKDEWSSFKDEVIEEQERLEKEANSSKNTSTSPNSDREDLIQNKIDHLRSKVIEINKNIEAKN